MKKQLIQDGANTFEYFRFVLRNYGRGVRLDQGGSGGMKHLEVLLSDQSKIRREKDC